jgi:TonB family protein
MNSCSSLSASLAASILVISGCATVPISIPVAVTYNVTHTGSYIIFSEADVKPRPLHMEQPIYPPEFREAGVAGEALTEFIVDTSGTPTQIQIVHAADAAFARAALQAMRHWRFSVGIKDGTAMSCLEQIPIEFEVTK